MATIEQRESGWWQAKVRRKGYPVQSRTFQKKTDAGTWARDVENQMDRGIFVSRVEAERTSFAAAADRYRREVLPSKRGGDRDAYRLNQLVEVFGGHSLAAITSSMIATFRDKRLKFLAPQSVVHELNLLSRVFKAATLDWGIALPSGIPTAAVRKPSINNERTRRFCNDEETRLFAAIELSGAGERSNSWTGPVVRFAIETAARQSEILSLDWGDVDLDRRVARVRGVAGRATKNDDLYRDIPLSVAAKVLLTDLASKNGKVIKLKRGRVFQTTAAALKKSWERALARARQTYEIETLRSGLMASGMQEAAANKELRKVIRLGGRRPVKEIAANKLTLQIAEQLKHDSLLVDLHFHDLRHEATSRLAGKLQLHELMKVTGHKSTRMLARYYHPRAEDLARKLG